MSAALDYLAIAILVAAAEAALWFALRADARKVQLAANPGRHATIGLVQIHLLLAIIATLAWALIRVVAI